MDFFNKGLIGNFYNGDLGEALMKKRDHFREIAQLINITKFPCPNWHT